MVILLGSHGARGVIVLRTIPENVSIAKVPRLPKQSLTYDL
jgi:hypothetical protein